jgi:menaquinone-dependent protoporphyrinogen IX oxidase
MAGPTRVLVTYASKMGSTQEIAEAIGRELETSGIQVTVTPCADNVSPESFDGVIIGSAIYTRRWVKAAKRFLKRHAPSWTRTEHGCSRAAQSARERGRNRFRLLRRSPA